jgi:hypothetical protein
VRQNLAKIWLQTHLAKKSYIVKWFGKLKISKVVKGFPHSSNLFFLRVVFTPEFLFYFAYTISEID